MISFNFETDFKLENENAIANWISRTIDSENFIEGEINYIFCDDDYLLRLNMEFLKHNTLTDIISFDNKIGKNLHGDIYISVDRVIENANTYRVHFLNELSRVMVHGVLHFCGYKDKSTADAVLMREKENFYLSKLVL